MTIPDGVTSIGDYAFHYCTSLATVNYDGTEEQWKTIKDSSCGLSGSTIIGKDTDGKETTWTAQ